MVRKKTRVVKYQKKYLRKYSALKTGGPTSYGLNSEEIAQLDQPMIDRIEDLEDVPTSPSTNASEKIADIIINQDVQCEKGK